MSAHRAPSKSAWLAFMGAGLIACAASANDWSLVSGNGYPPYADQHLPGGGLATKVVEAAFAAVGDRVQVEWLPWRRGYALARAGRYVATYPYMRTPEREADFLYSDPVVTGASFLYALKDAPFPLTSEGFKGRRLCLPHGWTSPTEQALKQAILTGEVRVERPIDLTACAMMVKMGRADGFSALEPLAEAVLRRSGLGPFFRRGEQPVSSLTLALIAPRRLPGSAALIERFNEGLRRIRANGVAQRLMELE
jgi:polar amino acid transport system substrate-binding protein